MSESVIKNGRRCYCPVASSCCEKRRSGGVCPDKRRARCVGAARECRRGSRGLTGARSRLVGPRLALLLRPTKPFPLVVVVVAAGGVVLRVVFPGGLARLLGTRVRLRTFALLRRGRAHHRFDVAAQRQLLLLLHEGDAHGGRVRHGRLVVLLAERGRRDRVRRRVLRRRGGEREERVGMMVLGRGEGLVGGRAVLLEAAAPRAAAQGFRLQPRVQRRVEVRPAHLPAAAAQRPTCKRKTIIKTRKQFSKSEHHAEIP